MSTSTTPDRRPPGQTFGDVVAVTGSIGAERAAELERIAGEGGVVLLVPEPGDECGARLAGARVEATLPRAEWFVTLADRAENVRLDGEVPVISALRTLDIVDPNTVAAATTSVRFLHQPTMAVRTVGRGRIVTSGIADLDALHAHPTLGTFLRRLVRTSFAANQQTDLGVGVVGYGPFGGMGYLHGLAATETDGLALVAAADSAPERLHAATQDFPELHLHPSAKALAADDAVDIAIIATPPVHHAELALELLRAGKHVVVEKPMCLKTDDADLLVRTAAEVDRTITVHQSRRWDTDWLAIRRIIGRGDLGDVFNIETFVGGFEHPCRAWHSEDTISGGAVYDWGSHHVDWIIQHYGTAPAKVLCTAHTRVWHDTTNVDQLAVWMQWSDGREATFRQSDVCAIRRPKFHVEGTAGTLEGHYEPVRQDTITPGRGFQAAVSHHAERPVDLRVARYDGDHGLIESTIPPAPHPGWGFHRNLADHLLLGEPLAVPAEQSRDVVAVLEAAHRSGANGGELIEL
ncbi:MAG: Gfo/Idh/MocA family oxidoreductase [Ilumatobacter sp.]|uniref:Gfo/Idh/MocA family protein n=1 Tax=Ilumatobacter sp. TaxID=1967498 RepID=UPI00261C1B80|nr:Gfo/Idh/MocA family oxidoreductase [Ilumatobacter sp.]MDJ0768911.1 Gfo/Idh/MocA family oxidoreductase [Ilumatobacter sp.]